MCATCGCMGNKKKAPAKKAATKGLSSKQKKLDYLLSKRNLIQTRTAS